MSITTIHEELSLEDLDYEEPDIVHAFCGHCYPHKNYPPDARYLCGKEIQPPGGTDECVVCANVQYCPICGAKLHSEFST